MNFKPKSLFKKPNLDKAGISLKQSQQTVSVLERFPFTIKIKKTLVNQRINHYIHKARVASTFQVIRHATHEITSLTANFQWRWHPIGYRRAFHHTLWFRYRQKDIIHQEMRNRTRMVLMLTPLLVAVVIVEVVFDGFPKRNICIYSILPLSGTIQGLKNWFHLAKFPLI